MTRRIANAYWSTLVGLLDLAFGLLIDAWTTRHPLYVEPPPWNDGTD